MRASLRLAAVCLAGWVVTAGAQQPDTVPLDAMLERASTYTLDFLEKFSNVVSEEKYVQESSSALPTITIPGLNGGRGGAQTRTGMAKRRELKSDFLIVKSADDNIWLPFRDVFEVDRIAVRDREERVTKLFLRPSADSDARAVEIANESARYNLGELRRTINNPVFALIFLRPEFLSHFRFALGKADKRMGNDVWIVEYVEESRPTLIRGLPGQEMPAHGRFWIEAETGRVVKTEVLVNEHGVKASLTTVFRVEDRLGLSVPVEMHEDYDVPGGHIIGTASYGRFRRFEVNAIDEVKPPSDEVKAPQ